MLKKVLITAIAAGFVGSFVFGINSAPEQTSPKQASVAQDVAVQTVVAKTAGADLSPKHQDISRLLAAKLNFKVSSVSDSAIPGLFEVVTDQGIFYVNADASNLIQGSLYQVSDAGVIDLTEQAMGKVRQQAIQVLASETINYPAENEKYSITVFTDINCGYCRKLHNEVAELNQLGVSVKYLAFPRGGLNSPTYQDMASIWCAEDKVQAMDNAKRGGKVVPEMCTNTVAKQYELGRRLGVTGTPAIVFDNGQMQPGYVPAAQLVNILEQMDKS
ncbi:bifunctional protein-disulfide isomerase/oxidoreductase DsbC [Moritella sp. F3]|uniref:bifunctional protein-disulfide isomerase/oxidoreductase DsbC n=1 Tax=Moritella sp. F3 TaxID=2718882 RepID=UPI0018E1BF1A|nr:bifunctional protein-disulfide isomerase/oxidoreductase DsbC [Moritella sp. F3]GIC77870.1 thiol:disulfide interchange protein DsbC [Moritella sp. F1]GIC82441.1 thiol:disulfide interchange protein DsbC [Moritella sp. F3]